MTCASSEDLDRPGHHNRDLRLLHAHSEDSDQTDWADAQADLSPLGAQAILLVLSFCGSQP